MHGRITRLWHKHEKLLARIVTSEGIIGWYVRVQKCSNISERVIRRLVSSFQAGLESA